jgi:addiction module RelB/DinJ family antitoxin
MAATTLLRTRVDKSRAQEAKKILAGLGLKPGDAVNLLFAQIVNRRGLPFAVQEEGYAYAKAEYGVSPAELDQAAKSIHRESEQARRRGEIKSLPADWRDLRKGA